MAVCSEYLYHFYRGNCANNQIPRAGNCPIELGRCFALWLFGRRFGRAIPNDGLAIQSRAGAGWRCGCHLGYLCRSHSAVNADGFLARDIPFENAAGPGSQQAVALRVDSDHSAFYNCAFLGHQDTLYTHILRQFYRNCRIEGTVDFIFGDSAAIFENCLILLRPRQINSDKGSSDPVTAQGRTDPAEPTGFVFHNCTINGTEEYMRAYYANPKIYKGYLGRPWKMYSRAIFINSYLGEAISPEGWMPWIGDFALNTLYYGEYQNYGPGAKVSGRTPWSNQIPESNVGMYTVGNFIQGDEWLPDTIN